MCDADSIKSGLKVPLKFKKLPKYKKSVNVLKIVNTLSKKQIIPSKIQIICRSISYFDKSVTNDPTFLFRINGPTQGQCLTTMYAGGRIIKS